MSRSRAVPWLVVALGAATVVAVLSGRVGAGGARDALDQAFADWLRPHVTSVLERAMTLISLAHRPRGIVLGTATAGALLWWWRDRLGALLLLTSVSLGSTLNHLLKHSVMRPRPGLDSALSAFTDYSFPSGHAANATLLYGTLAALVFRRAASDVWRVLACAAAATMVLLVGFSRLVLGAHHLSDVVAGVALGVACMALCLALREGMLERIDRA